MTRIDNHTDLPFKLVKLKPDANEDMNSKIHRHNYFELFVFKEEGKNHFIDFKDYPVEQNSIHIVIPSCIHLLKRNYKTEGYVLLFSEAFYHLNFQGTNLWLEIIPTILKSGAAFKINPDTFKLILELCNHIDLSKDENMRRTYLQLIILHLKSTFQVQKTIENSIDQNLAYQYRQLVENHFMENHKIIFYATKLNVSVISLNRKVQEVFSVSPTEIILERILLEAKRLLFHNEYSAKEIAYKIGFKDNSYFSRFFKSKTGQSPNQFRKESRLKYL